MEWTDIRLTVAKADADNAEAVATMIAEGGIYIEDYSDIEQQVAEIAHVDLIEQELLLDVAVVFDINTALGDHGGNGFGVVSVGLGHGQADISPFHNAVSFYFASSPSPSPTVTDSPFCHLR